MTTITVRLRPINNNIIRASTSLHMTTSTIQESNSITESTRMKVMDSKINQEKGKKFQNLIF